MGKGYGIVYEIGGMGVKIVLEMKGTIPSPKNVPIFPQKLCKVNYYR